MADLKEAQFANLESLFDADLADIADLASFETPPTGAYILKATTSTKDINKKPAVVADFEVVETVELKDSEAKQSVPGTRFSIAFILGNSVSEGRLKQFLAPFAEHFGVTNVGALIRDTIKDVTIACSVTNRASKDDPEVIYAGVKNVVVS